MASVSEVTIKYAARGARAARKSDEKVRDSIKKTARTARKESGSIRQWMQRHKTALVSIGAATAMAMGMIIKQSPELSAQLSSVRLGFSLLAMTLGSDVAPATEGIGSKVIELADAYAELDPAIRKPISALVALVSIGGIVAGVVAGLQTLISGTVVASFLGWAASALSLSSIMYSLGGAVAVVEFVLGTLAAALGISVGAVAALIAIIGIAIAVIVAYIFNIGGARDAINGWAADTKEFVADSIKYLGKLKNKAISRVGEMADSVGRKYEEVKSDAVSRAEELYLGFIGWLGMLPGKAREKASDVQEFIENRLGSLPEDARRWGKDMMENFIGGIKNKINEARRVAKSVENEIKKHLSFDRIENDRMAERWGSDLVQHFGKGMESNLSRLRRAAPEQRPGSFGFGSRQAAPASGGSGGGGGQQIEIRIEEGAIQMRGTGSASVNTSQLAEEVSDDISNKFGRR